MAKYEKLRLENQLCHRFYTASNALTRAYRELLEDLDVTYPQYIVLMALWENDGITIHELIEKTRIDGGSLSLILRKMRDKGILSIISSSGDKRVRIVSLTGAGKRLREKAASIPDSLLCNIPSLSPAEFHTLKRLIDKLNNDLHAKP